MPADETDAMEWRLLLNAGGFGTVADVQRFIEWYDARNHHSSWDSDRYGVATAFVALAQAQTDREENERLKVEVEDWKNGTAIRDIAKAMDQANTYMAIDLDGQLTVAKRELTAARERIAALERGLEPFAKFGTGWNAGWVDAHIRLDETKTDECPTIKDCIAAAALLAVRAPAEGGGT